MAEGMKIVGGIAPRVEILRFCSDKLKMRMEKSRGDFRPETRARSPENRRGCGGFARVAGAQRLTSVWEIGRPDQIRTSSRWLIGVTWL